MLDPIPHVQTQPRGSPLVSSPPGSGAFGETLRMNLLRENDDGSVEVSVDVEPLHFREGGIVHGGVMMTMLDSAMAASIRRTTTPEEWIASINISTDFLVAAREGRLTAKGWPERRGKSLAFARGELRDASGALVARAQGIWAVRSR